MLSTHIAYSTHVPLLQKAASGNGRRKVRERCKLNAVGGTEVLPYFI